MLLAAMPLITRGQVQGQVQIQVQATLDLNQATRAEIESARGVGVELAERVLQARRGAPFADWQDVRRRVKGVSRRALEGLAESGFHIAGQVPASR